MKLYKSQIPRKNSEKIKNLKLHESENCSKSLQKTAQEVSKNKP